MKPLPPSSKTVLRILGAEGALTHKDIVKKSHCSPRTVRFALRRLKENDLIIEKANIRDMRQIIYQNRMVQPQENRMAESVSGSYLSMNLSSPVG
ncbi:MAG: winged helix-turn-helix transcriptional regulator [Methanoregula sp.]|jgi:transcription initiation factor IIE alpha subunit|uniref:winged helix-turn-helix transcriptional regulator n=1 Tax=Methanoregula sp. TaxID=2052170 RepID=UPI0025D52A0B|nr:winged helix-turn-helix transcriptional regulator [Methanoregula sp.]MCK9632252.1 winged helix-turn-helix transcriptional regulator [Methanoregula sp.]